MLTRRTLTALGLAAWAAPVSAEPVDVLARVRRDGVMRVGAVNAQPPYSNKDPVSGEWVGFMVDAAADLATTLGVRVVPVESTWGNAVLDIQADKVDVFFGLAPTPQRALAVQFTRPLYDNAFALIARPGFAPSGWSDLDRPEVRVAVELGTVYDQNIARLCPQATVTRLRSNNEAMLSVQAGRADAQILVVILALVSLAKNRGIGHLVVPQPVFASPTAAIIARTAGQDWHDTVDGWIADRRKTGWMRKTLVANLERAGVAGADVPAQLLF